MSLRRIAVLALALAAGCVKDVAPEGSPAFVDYSVFDPSSGAIPLPNDLALATASSLAPGVQTDLVVSFAAQGGFPSDLELPITIEFTRTPVGPGASTPVALDLGTVTPATVVLLKLTATGAVPAAYDAAAVTQTQGATRTTLQLRAPAAADGTRYWEVGARYAVAVRGGASGVKTADGGEIRPMPAMYLLLAGKDLSDPANQALLPDAAAGAQLEQIRQSYLPLFLIVDRIFPADELANVQTFQIAPGAYVRVDQTAGVVPLPFDLLRTDADGTIINNPAFGPAAVGLDTLDGFSTTAMILAQTSAPIDAATVPANVLLYKLGAGTATRLSDVAGALGAGDPAAARFLAQPPALNQACTAVNGTSGTCSTVIGLQPAVPVPTGTAAGTLYLPPLDEASEYAVIVTRGVKDATGRPLGRSLFAHIVLDVVHPLVAGGVSQVPGLGLASATMAAHMQEVLAPVWSALPAGVTKADVAMAYTFKTQSVTGAALQLSALPYGVERAAGAALFVPAAVTPVNVTTTYGVPGAAVAQVDSFYSAAVPSLDVIDPTTGALEPSLATLGPAELAALVKPLPALVAVPQYANVPSCGFPAPNDALHCAKLVLFHHGLGGGHLQMIGMANALAAQGFVVAAVDFPLHGDRAPCSQVTAANDCNDGGTCTVIAGSAGQGDADPPNGYGPPGVCSNGNRLNASLTSVASGRYFISANFFRTRDAFRQNLVDQSALTLAFARPPAPGAFQPAADPFAAALLAKGIVVDPSAVYWEGISLGGIAGTEVLATNPRVTRGALSVPGGTLTDVFTTAPAFSAQVDALFASLGIDRNDPADAAAYLQTVNVVKWILDPAEPLNFAKHVVTSPLPNLLSATGALQSPKEPWMQIAQGDLVIPNAYNLLLSANGAIPYTWYTRNGGDAPHSMLASSPTAQAQAAAWLRSLTNPGAAQDLTDL